MNEPPGARLRVALTALTQAEYFRDQGQDVLIFLDNIFRYTLAGSEVSALLGRMPSAVGYQPNLGTDMGGLQERITTTKKGSITSMQAILRPCRRLDRPGGLRPRLPIWMVRSFCPVLISETGIYPAVGPSARLYVACARSAERRRRALSHCPSRPVDPAALQRASDIMRFSVWKSFRKTTNFIVSRARKLQSYLSQPFMLRKPFTGTPASMSSSKIR